MSADSENFTPPAVRNRLIARKIAAESVASLGKPPYADRKVNSVEFCSIKWSKSLDFDSLELIPSPFKPNRSILFVVTEHGECYLLIWGKPQSMTTLG